VIALVAVFVNAPATESTLRRSRFGGGSAEFPKVMARRSC